MEASNPYQPPEAEVQLEQSNATSYQPKFFTLRGRLNRARYVCYSGAWGLWMIASVTAMLFVIRMEGIAAIVAVVAALVCVFIGAVFAFSVVRRRINDLGYSGWFSLIVFIPYVGTLMWSILMLAPGSEGENTYGVPAIKNEKVKIAAWIIGPLYILMTVSSLLVPEYQEAVNRFITAQFSR